MLQLLRLVLALVDIKSEKELAEVSSLSIVVKLKELCEKLWLSTG